MARNSRKDKWRNVSINPSNIDEYIIDLIEDTKGQYITQGVSFNKDDSFQMGLLKHAILDHSSFSGLVKHLLTLYFSGQPIQSPNALSQPSIAFHPTREIQKTASQIAASRENTPSSEPSSKPIVDVGARTRTKAISQPSTTKQQGEKRRTTPRRPSGGGFLQANPNAKLPTDPSAN